MRKAPSTLDRNTLQNLMHSMATVGCASGVLLSGQTKAASVPDLDMAQTFPVAPVIAKRPIRRTLSRTGTLSEPAPPRAAALPRWQLGSRNWHHAVNKTLGVTVGSAEVVTSVFVDKTTLGGLHIQQSALPLSHASNDLTVSMAVGALDYSGKQGKGDLAYGPAAASTAVRYGSGKHMAFESGIQWAPDLLTATLGGRYDARRWGQLRAGIAHGSLSDQRGWRYLTLYDVHLMDSLRVSMRNEWSAQGFADLAHYRNGAAAGVRSNLSAVVPTRRWGDMRGTYETFRPADGLSTQRLGFSQQFWYSPNLRVDLQAQRELVSGDYDVGIRFSVPIK